MKLFISSICLMYLVFCLPAYADPVANNMHMYTEDVLKVCRDTLSELRTNYRIQVATMILVGLLGVLAALLQSMNSTFVKKATVAVGFAISAITVVANTLDMNNHKQIAAKIERAKSAVDRMVEAQRMYVNYPAPHNEVGLEDFRKHHLAFLSIVAPPDNSPTGTSHSRLTLFPAAYADSNLPKWLTTPPENSRNLYFVGVADSFQLRDAQTEANQNAKAAATQFLRGAIDTSMESSAASTVRDDDLASTAEEVENHVTYDDKTKIYRYYSLVRVNRLQAQTDTQFLYLKSGSTLPPESFNSIAVAHQDDTGYQAKRLALQLQQINQVQSTLSAPQSKNFSDARQARRVGDQGKAILLLQQLVEELPDFYLGWFNLALAYSKDNQDQQARLAYQRAIELEPLQKSRDSSIYNTYGHFLLERREYCESREMLQQAVTVEPLNTLAQRNLLKATSDMTKNNVTCS